MHMANELLSPTVALAGGVLALAGLAGAARRLRDRASSSLVPLMGVLGAFVFAAQMVNFVLPAIGGVSDHLIGTVLLAILLGPHAAAITMAGILVIQCLFFQDGGLLALGVNVINMGLLPAYVGYGLWRWLIGRGEPVAAGRLLAATWTAAFLAVVLGSAAVCAEVGLSGRAVPLAELSAFTGVVVGIHVLSGAIEGVITYLVIVFLYKLYPDLSRRSFDWTQRRVNRGSLAAMFLVLAAVVAGLVSWLASPYADGLEWSISRHPAVVQSDRALGARVTDLQTHYTPLPDYSVRHPSRRTNAHFWTSFSGILGVGLTMGLVWLLGRMAARYQRRAR